MKDLKFSNSINFKILDSLAEGVYIVDKEFKIIFVNKSAEKITGISKDDVLGKSCKSFCKSDRCEIACPVTEVLKTNENIIDLDSLLQNKNGKLIPVKLNAAVLKDNDNLIGSIISFSDATDQIDIDTYLREHPNFYGIIGKSKVMLNIFKTIEEIARSEASVLVTGETGVGKELIAEAIKQTSSRKNNKFVKVNCAALPNNILASELFGHVKGAFTDAVNERIGRFEYADGGTILLDEIGEMPINMQTKLLRVIQEGTFEKLGDNTTKKINVRIIATTNKDLQQEIKLKRFRSDLYYRLNVIPITVPSLRERKDDIPLIANFFVKKFANLYKRKIDVISDEAMEALIHYDWPGNVRELENAIEYAFIRSKQEDKICICCLPPIIRKQKIDCNKKIKLNQIQNDEKMQTLMSLLRNNNWNKTKVAKILGVNRSTVYRQLKNINNN